MKYIILFAFICSINFFGYSQIPTNKLNEMKNLVSRFPDSLKLHEDYLEASYKDTIIYKQYDQWIKTYPKSSKIPFAIGKYYYRQDNSRAEFYLQEAVKRDSNLAEAWYLLAINAQIAGNTEKEIYYSLNAEKKDKKNGKYALEAAYCYYKVDKKYADSTMLEVVRKFKSDDTGAEALVLMTLKEKSQLIKKIYLNQLYELYKDIPNKDFLNGMNMLYAIFINEGAYKDALKLSTSMVIRSEEDRLNWRYLEKTAKHYLAVNDFLSNNQPDSAMLWLDKIKLRNSFTNSYITSEFSLLKLKADCYQLMGKPDSSYKLVLREFAKEPKNNLYDLLNKYGILINKKTKDIDNDIREFRYLHAEQAHNLTRINLIDSSKVSLSDFKGKVILLSFWYPSCGPCRSEMPHIENVLKKINRDELVYLAINVLPIQDVLVKSFLDNTGFTFIPLNDDKYGDKDNLRAGGYPANFLIDKQGKIVFKNFLVNDKSEESLEMMINDLINY